VKQYLSDKNVARLRAITGQPYRYALVRGNWHDAAGRWCQAALPSADDRLNADWVNRDTGAVYPLYRHGERVHAPRI
jgi:hypothetical protein